MLRTYLLCRNLFLAVVVIVGGMVFIAGPASAHHPTFDVAAVCDPTTGTYDVTWTIKSDQDYNKDWKLTAISRPLAGITLNDLRDDQTNFVGTESVSPGTSLSLDVTARWQNKGDADNGVVTESRSGTYKVPATRCDPDAQDAEAVLTTTPPVCGVGERLVLGSTRHATWGVPSLTEGPGAYLATATADPHHRFPNGSSTKDYHGTLAGPLPDDNGPNLPGCDRGDQPDPTQRQATDSRSACDLRDVGGTEWWTDEWTTTYVWSDQTGWTPQETGPVRIAEWFVPFTDDEYFAECARDQPEDLVRGVSGAEESCELQGTVTWTDLYTTVSVWNPVTRAWQLGDETGPVRTDEQYVPYSDDEFEEKCAEEPEVAGEQAQVMDHEAQSPGAEAAGAEVPTAVDAGTAEESPLQVVGGSSLWLMAIIGGLSLLGVAGWRRHRTADR